MNIVEYVGLTQEATTLIESFRSATTESKSDIIVRVLSAIHNQKIAPANNQEVFDLGQGAYLKLGETITLYLSEESKRLRHPDATAEVRRDGIYMNGKRVRPSKGSPLQAGMRAVQEKRNHRNEKGEFISLSAWRQWHVERNGQIMPIFELKDPALAHKRGRIKSELTLQDLGL